MQSLNDAGLHHQLQAKGVTTLEGALQAEEDYLCAKRLYTEETRRTRVTAEAVQSLGDEMGRLSAMLKRVAKTLTNVNPPSPNRGPERETLKTAALCGRCSTPGHFRSRCPQLKRPPHFRKPRKTPRPRGPGKEQPRGGYRRASKRTSRDTPPVSGRYRDEPGDPIGDGNRLCYHLPTALASYRKRSRPARSIRTSEWS